MNRLDSAESHRYCATKRGAAEIAVDVTEGAKRIRIEFLGRAAAHSGGRTKAMHYILFYDVVEKFTDGRTPFRGAHLAAVRDAFERGELVLAGALAEPADGAVLVFRGASPKTAETFARNDPYVKNGLVKEWRVRKWMTVVGDGATPPI